MTMADDTAHVQALIDSAGPMGRVTLENRTHHVSDTLELRSFVTLEGGEIETSAPVGVHIGADVNGARVRTPIIYRGPEGLAASCDKGSGSECPNVIDLIVDGRVSDENGPRIIWDPVTGERGPASSFWRRGGMVGDD